MMGESEEKFWRYVIGGVCIGVGGFLVFMLLLGIGILLRIYGVVH